MSFKFVVTLRVIIFTEEKKIEIFEAQFENSDIIRNKMDQYSHRNNVVVQCISSRVKKVSWRINV